MKEVVISDGVKKINKGAFEKCAALGKITIPASVTEIDPDAFKDCPADMIIITTKGSAAAKFANDKKKKDAWSELTELEKTILAKTDAAKLPTAVYNKMRLRVTSSGSNFIQLKWKAVSGATGYAVYGALRKGKFTKIATVTTSSYKHDNLKKNKFYKYMVIAISGGKGMEKVLGASETVIAATAGGKYRNTSSVTLSKKKAKLKTGKTLKLKGKAASNKSDGKKYKTFRKLIFESSNPLVATVTSKGKIKAIGKGKCYVYVYTQDGTYKRIKVTVK